jgi:pimeloyl-ACP methyl ester carboxylesterase
MKFFAMLVACAALVACTEVNVDESRVFAPVEFDKALAAQTGEVIDGEKGFASADAWNATWAKRVASLRLAEPVLAFAPATIEHGVTPSGIAWSLVSRPSEGRPLVVRCGGNASTRQMTGFTYTAAAIDHGDVLLFDYPGSGETGGEVSTPRFVGMSGDLVALIRAKAGSRKLVLWGHSLGGFVCSDLARQMPETKAVILETTARNAAETAKAWTPWYAGPFVRIKIGPGIDAYDNATALKDFKGPILVFGATQDKTLPVQLARSLNKALKEEGLDVTYVEFPDGGHSTSAHEPGFREAVDRVFAKIR